MTPPHLAMMVGICLLWGMNFVVAKAGIGHFPPIFFTVLRFGAVALVLLPYLKRHPAMRMRQILWIALLGGALHYALVFAGLAFIDVSVAAIAAQLGVPFLTLLSIVFLGEVVRWKRWLGIGLSFSGVAAMSLESAAMPDWRGVLLVSLGAGAGSGAIILMRRLRNVGALEMQAWFGIISAPCLLVLSLLFETGQVDSVGSAGAGAWAAVAYTAIASSVIAHAGFYFLIQRYEASIVGPLTLMAPLFAVVAGVALMGDPVTDNLVAGGVLTLAGVLIIVVREGAQRKGKPAGTAMQAEAME